MESPKLRYLLAQDREIASLDHVPRLLLHSCCGPCSSACLELLAQHFFVTVLWYNPNIQPREEFDKRLFYQKKIIAELPTPHPVSLLVADYDGETYENAVQNLTDEPEGGARCTVCFDLRLKKTAEIAKAQGFEYFTTTLTVSPHKNAPLINELGEVIAREVGVKFLPSDFKKRSGYLRSLQLSEQYELYRQNYCGCLYSKKE